MITRIFVRASRIAIISAVAGFILLGGMGLATAGSEAKLGHLESPLQSRHVHLMKVAELVKQRTSGAVTFKLFPARQLGNQREMTEGVQLGTIEATMAPAAFLGGFNPAVSVLDIPFLLPADAGQAQKILEGPLGRAVLDSFSSRGIVAVAIWPNGIKNFTSNKPLPNPASFKGQKFRVMDSRILIEQFNALGASAIALSFGELYTSLQTGVVDGQENPLDTIQRMKFHEVQKHLVLSGHGALIDVALFNAAWWNKLAPDHQTIIRAAFAEIVPQLRTHKAAAIQQALLIIKKSDTTIRTVGAAERKALRAAMYPRARNAYLKRAGAEGAKLIEIYEREYAKVTGK